MSTAETLFSRCCDWTWTDAMLTFASPTRMVIDAARVKSAESAPQVGNSWQTCMDIGDFVCSDFYNGGMEVVMHCDKCKREILANCGDCLWTTRNGLRVCRECYRCLVGRYPMGLRELNEQRKQE